MTPDRHLAAIAARQHGLFTAADVISAGFTRGEAQTRRRTGRWENVAPGVWRISGSPRSWRADLWAWSRALGDEAAISHSAAAALHGFDRFPEGPLEFTVARSARRRRSTGPTVHTSSQLALIDRSTVDGLRVTSASRTVVDLAATRIDDDRLAAAVDSAIRRGASSPTFLRRRVQALRGPGRAGVRRLDRLLVDSGGHSRLERAFLAIVRRAGLPRPRVQVVHRRDGAAFARVDFEWTEQRLVTEVSGQRGHASEAERAKDACRQNELQADGFRVLEFTTSHVFGQPSYVASTLAHHLGLM